MSMADRDQKTEKATPRQRERFREEGKVAVSREIISVAVLLGSAGTLLWMAGRAGRALGGFTTGLLGRLDQHLLSGQTQWLGGVAGVLAATVLPVGAAGALCAVGAGAAQTRGLFTPKPLAPNLEVLNPLPRLKQIFFSKQAAATVLISAGKVLVIGGFTADLFARELRIITGLGRVGLPAAISQTLTSTLHLGARVLPLLAIFALIDFVLTRRRMEEQMRMTKKEVRDEAKDQEGDPEIRGKRRARQREMGQRRMMAAIPDADVVLTNPTHYAVALRYDPAAMSAPTVVAKGADHLAARIREEARRHEVPVMRQPRLARALYADVSLDREIPPALYGAVAEILAVVYRLRGGDR